jgi:two-component system response regulator RegA
MVDDDACSREPLAQWFRDARWSVRTASTCSQAAEVAAASIPDYLVVEQRLLDGTGFDLLPRLRKLNPAIAGIVLTRAPAIAAAVHAIRTGFRDYLAKPVDPRRLAFLLGVSGMTELGANGPGVANDVTELDDEPASLARVEWEHIHTVLLECRGNISEAARVLGLHRRSLQRKLRRDGPPVLSMSNRAR